MDAASEPPASRSKTFTHENLARPENRINVALFATQAIPGFWSPCCQLLGLSDNAWIKPVVIDGQQLRPDFQVYEHDEPAGWIEVELGGPDNAQIERYKAKLSPSRVISLVGPAANSDRLPSLEKVAELARNAAAEIGATNRPAKEVLLYLAKLIKDNIKSETPQPFPQDIPQRLRELPWFTRAVAPLLDLEREGFVVNRPTNSNSLSLRLKSGPSIRCHGSFALVTQRDQNYFLVPTPQEMDRIFCEPLKEVVKLWEALLCRIYPCWNAQADLRNRIRIDARTVETHADEFAAVYAALRDRLIPLGTGTVAGA